MSSAVTSSVSSEAKTSSKVTWDVYSSSGESDCSDEDDDRLDDPPQTSSSSHSSSPTNDSTADHLKAPPPKLSSSSGSASAVSTSSSSVGDTGLQPSEFTLRHSKSAQNICSQEYEARKLKRFTRRSSRDPRRFQNNGKDTAALVLLTGLHVAGDGFGSVVQDTFLPCFEPQGYHHWNWAFHLFVPWLVGIVLRFFILLPLRIIILLLGVLLFSIMFFAVQLICPKSRKRERMEARLIRFLASVFVVSWSGVVKYHGSPPDTSKSGKNPIFVANHTSMIDMVVLAQLFTFAVVGQKHGGWVGMLQTKVLSSLQSVWFDRGDIRDKMIVREKLRVQVSDLSRNPLLVFPEGTCVNNEYVIQFKQGVFQLGAPIAPIAIKYNKIFVDAFWNSRAESFTQYLLRLMKSWAVVCDVWFLEPQYQRPDETPAAFANRVKCLIAKRANLKITNWDGYMKHYQPSERYVESWRTAIAKVLNDVSGHGGKITSFVELRDGLHQRME